MTGADTPATPWHAAQLALLALWLPSWWLLGGMSASAAMAIWLVLNLTILATAEWRQGHRHAWRPDANDLRRDGSVWSLNLLTDALVGVAITAAAVALTSSRSALPLAVQILVGIYLAELGSYAIHRLSHRGGWLWRVHLLHHRPSKLNLANSLTAHPLNAAYDKGLRLAPLLLLGLDGAAITAVAMFQLTQALATHANIDGRIGWLNYLIGSAELHRLHHSSDPAQAGNYGTSVPLWDQLFGSFRYGQRVEEVGVYAPEQYPPEHAVGALLSWPWRRLAGLGLAGRRAEPRDSGQVGSAGT
jgi:sterol desaturase/sphingolipid hydroxylase (fatty acid hydroxylase superfamily)